MGVDIAGLQLILLAKKTHGLDLSDVATLGRQMIYFSPKQLQRVAHLGLPVKAESYAEELLRALGAANLTSLDASDYEGADVIVDFNKPLPLTLAGSFSTYIDFGSMEHIFDVRQVILNINHILREHGTALILTICDGQAGHGFYQYSPEFFYTVFSEANGFANTNVYLIDADAYRYWYKVDPPSALGRRVMTPVAPLLIACVTTKRHSVGDITAVQSDYANCYWRGVDERKPTKKLGKLAARWAVLSRYAGLFGPLVGRERRFHAAAKIIDIRAMIGI